jgi:putative ABC transport system permease protein
MELGPILSAMRRNKAGASVIVIQTAITLAILCNSLFIIQQRLRLSSRPTGAQEDSIFTIANQWVGNPPDLGARVQADLAALRAVPGVVDAFVSNSYPLSNGGWDDGISLEASDQHWVTQGALYFSDEHGLPTLGLKLVAGRNFNSTEIAERNDLEGKPPSAVIVSQALASTLFPLGGALGKSIYLASQKQKAPIVGIVDRLQEPWVSGGNRHSENAMLQPYRYVEQYSHYIVRARPSYTVVAAILVMLLGQIAVLWPALRAASISPVVAIRNV